MIEFQLPGEITIDAILDRVRGEPAGERKTTRCFYDTFDGLAHAAGKAVVYEDGRLALLELGTGEERAGLALERPAGPLLARELEPGPLRQALERIIDVRALLPLVEVATRAQLARVLDDAQKTVVRISLEQPAIVSASGIPTTLSQRLRLAPVRGYEEELDGVCAQLGFAPAGTPLLDEALQAAGRPPAGVPSKVEARLSFNQRADAAAVTVLRRLLAVIEANLEGTIADIDSEFLHDFRVSVRRSRSVQRQLRGVFGPAELQHFRDEFRWLQRVTGDARDLDVYVLEFDRFRALVPESMRAELNPLLSVLERRRRSARREMVGALRSERPSQLLADWSAFLEELVECSEDERPDASRPIGAVSGKRIRKVYRRIVKMGRSIDHSSPAAHYHELRKKGKELRYLLELFGTSLYPAEVVKPMIKSLKSLQDLLGRHQDREVQVGTLRSLRDELSGLPGGAAALMATGALVERLLSDEQAARQEFAERFAAFSSPSQRALVKDTFA